MRHFRLVLIVLLLAAPAVAGESIFPLAKKMTGKTGSQVIGVSSICNGLNSKPSVVGPLIDRAALDRPDLIILPEICMNTAPKGAKGKELTEHSELLSEGGPITKLLSNKAKKYRAYIMAGYYRKDSKGRGHYNSAVLFDREGKIVGCYDKMFPTVGGLERGTIPGNSAPVFDTDFGRIAAAICFDLNFEELFIEYKKKNVELLCFLSAFRGGRMVPALAMRNRMFIASAVPRENGVVYDSIGRKLNESSAYGRIIFTRINLDSKVIHIDFNHRKIPALKKKYGELVQIEAASPEAVYLLSSLHPDVTVEEMIEEFDLETLDEYLDRSRTKRIERLGEVEGKK
jgi:predicted amidohydrolase